MRACVGSTEGIKKLSAGYTEFSGTLVGFDDYVSTYSIRRIWVDAGGEGADVGDRYGARGCH